MQPLLAAVICCLITLSSGRSLGHKVQNSFAENSTLMYTPPQLQPLTPSGGNGYHLAPALLLQQSQQQQHTASQSPEQIKDQTPISRNGLEEKAIESLPTQQHSVLHPQQFPYQIQPRKHYKIMVILRRPTLTTAPPPVVPEVEEETLIYVLVKKPDEHAATDFQLTQQAERDDIQLNKPEVYFINYKSSSEKQQVNLMNH